MTALSIAEAERRSAANPQVTAPRPRREAEDGDLASVTDLAGGAATRYRRSRKNQHTAGVSRPAPARRRAAPARVTIAPPGASAPGGAGATARPRGPEWSGSPMRPTRIYAPGRPAAQRGTPGRPGTRTGMPGIHRDAPGRRAAPTDAVIRPASPRAQPAPLRLTARGRKVVTGLAVAIGAAAVCLVSLTAAGGASAASHGQPGGGFRGMKQVVVQRGQTLWSIAGAAEPTADPLAVIQQIIDANSLPSATIEPGEVLWVPRA